MTRTYIGVDISRDTLDIHDPDRGETRIPNTAPGIARWLRRLPADAQLVCEATSRYDRLLLAAADKRAIGVARINPLHGWHFAQSLNLPKTDRMDAAMLARFGRERRPEPTPQADPARVELGALGRRRDQLIRMATQETNRLGEATSPILRKDLEASLRQIEARIARIEKAIAAHLKAHPALDAQARLLRSIPGIGPVAAVELLAHLPQLGHLDRRAIASLGGLAPKAKDSGKHRGQRRLGPGRRHVRAALYHAGLSALRHPRLFGGAGARMRAAGKPGKVMVMALARKILTIANAVLRDATPFRPPQNPA